MIVKLPDLMKNQKETRNFYLCYGANIGQIEEVINNENDLLHLKIIRAPEDLEFKIDEFGFKIEKTKIGISSLCNFKEIS